MPAVTLPDSPSGLPSATTSCPTWRVVASPSTTGSGTGPVARRTARSESGSLPVTSTVAWVPSANSAVACRAPSTTWALVSRKPSEVTTLALPAPSPRAPRTRRLATLGSTCRATLTTAAE